jgi:hypothetical protein
MSYLGNDQTHTLFILIKAITFIIIFILCQTLHIQNNVTQQHLILYSALANKVECSYHLLASSWNYMTHYHVLKGFPDTIQVLLHTNNKINLPVL